MAINRVTALSLIKARLNRLQEDTSLDDYLSARLEGAVKALEDIGINLQEDSDADMMLVVDYTVWQYSNRDKPGAMPDWLRLRRRERWLQEVGANDS